MHLVITSQKPGTLDRWQRVFEGCADVSCQRGLRSETPVDAVLMAGLFAHGRYGGRPRFSEAEIRDNLRGDGWPALVVVPPTRPMAKDSQGNMAVHPDYADIQPAYFAATRCFQAIAEWNDTHEVPISSVEINLGLMNMDSPVDDSSARAFREAFGEYRERMRVTCVGHPSREAGSGPLEFTFSVAENQPPPPSGFDLGHVRVRGSEGEVSSRERAPDQAMMIHLSVTLLLDGVRSFLAGRDRVCESAAVDSSFSLKFARSKGGWVETSHAGVLVDRSTEKDLADALFRGADAFARATLPHLPPDDAGREDLEAALAEFEGFLGAIDGRVGPW
ncbi:hypothetical protein [Streptomyces sp. enrichment culture]|uniref:hypothetical protein n=1 Tax=Streptomyces sp. enrichment culture TaxID=1795815 RepID=UPI003F562F5F